MERLQEEERKVEALSPQEQRRGLRMQGRGGRGQTQRLGGLGVLSTKDRVPTMGRKVWEGSERGVG